MKKDIWFKGKRYGYGWYPVTIEGWFVVLVYLAVFIKEVLLFTYYIERGYSTDLIIFHLLFIFFITGILIYICYKKGEPLKWRFDEK